MPVWLKELLFNWFFEASCNKHDIGYSQGGDELWRWYCDLRFLLAMLRDIRRVRWPLKPVALLMAIVFYIIVVFTGWTRFNYR